MNNNTHMSFPQPPAPLGDTQQPADVVLLAPPGFRCAVDGATITTELFDVGELREALDVVPKQVTTNYIEPNT